MAEQPRVKSELGDKSNSRSPAIAHNCYMELLSDRTEQERTRRRWKLHGKGHEMIWLDV